MATSLVCIVVAYIHCTCQAADQIVLASNCAAVINAFGRPACAWRVQIGEQQVLAAAINRICAEARNSVQLTFPTAAGVGTHVERKRAATIT
jgi:hypothetical protein